MKAITIYSDKYRDLFGKIYIDYNDFIKIMHNRLSYYDKVICNTKSKVIVCVLGKELINDILDKHYYRLFDVLCNLDNSLQRLNYSIIGKDKAQLQEIIFDWIFITKIIKLHNIKVKLAEGQSYRSIDKNQIIKLSSKFNYPVSSDSLYIIDEHIVFQIIYLDIYDKVGKELNIEFYVESPIEYVFDHRLLHPYGTISFNSYGPFYYCNDYYLNLLTKSYGHTITYSSTVLPMVDMLNRVNNYLLKVITNSNILVTEIYQGKLNTLDIKSSRLISENPYRKSLKCDIDVIYDFKVLTDLETKISFLVTDKYDKIFGSKNKYYFLKETEVT